MKSINEDCSRRAAEVLRRGPAPGVRGRGGRLNAGRLGLCGDAVVQRLMQALTNVTVARFALFMVLLALAIRAAIATF